MQSAETVLSVLRDRGGRGLPCDELYRQLFNPQLYLLAYGRLYSNQGAMTAGVDGETVDGMSAQKIGRIVDALRHERYRFKPARRVYIPKKNGKKRPLGLPSWSDKLVGEVIRLLLEAYYEPRFSARSHGFRPRRGCHTALSEVAEKWTGTTWFIEGDISDCFGSLDHEVMLSTLAENIRDNRFLRLLRNMLQAGYLEDWVWNATLSGAPQGGVVSPILSNIYLDRLDRFVETVLIPEYTRGDLRRNNNEFDRVRMAANRAYKRGDRQKASALRKQLRGMPSKDPDDPGYRRLRYTRYADDHRVIAVHQFGPALGFAEFAVRGALGLDHVPWYAQPDDAVDLPADLAVLDGDLVAEEPGRARAGVGDQGLALRKLQLEIVEQELSEALFDLFGLGLRSGEPEEVIVCVPCVPQPPVAGVLGIPGR